MENQNDNQDVSDSHAQTHIPVSTRKKSSRSLWILILIFIAFVTTVFLTQREDRIDWIEDYEAGLKLAEQQNKPVLLAFYKEFSRYCSDMKQNTYNNPKVIEYVESNFVPILIDVDKQPQIAERYKIGYYPTHYIKNHKSDKLSDPHIGYDVPSVYIRKLENLLKKMDLPDP